MFKKIVESVKKNAVCLGKCVVYGAATAVVTAGEMAGMIEGMNRICEGCDEDNPANAAQTFGVLLLGLVGTGAQTATLMGGMALIEHEIEENWE